MRAAQCRYLLRRAEVEGAFLRTKCFQCCAKSHAAEGRIQISQDTYDRARPAQLSPGRHALGDRALSPAWSIKCLVIARGSRLPLTSVSGKNARVVSQSISLGRKLRLRAALKDVLGGGAASVLSVTFGLSYTLLIFGGPLAPICPTASPRPSSHRRFSPP